MNEPLVSILIPVYNRESYIGYAIQSAISQNYKNIEIIISDNQSDDSTWSIVKGFQERDNRIRAFRNDINVGPILNWVNCVNRAQGEFSCFLFSDDILEDNYVKEMLKSIKNQRNIGFVFSSVQIFDNEGLNRITYNTKKTGLYSTKNYIEGIILGKNYPFSPGHALLRTKDIKKNIMINIKNNFNLDLNRSGIGADVLMFLLTSLQYESYFVLNEPLAKFRAHEDSITISTHKNRLQLSYYVTKTHFLENFHPNIVLIRKINAILIFESLKINKNLSKKIKPSNFYQNHKLFKINILYLVLTLLKKIINKSSKVVRWE